MESRALFFYSAITVTSAAPESESQAPLSKVATFENNLIQVKWGVAQLGRIPPKQGFR